MVSGFYIYKRVGYFKEKIAEELGVEITGTIYVSQKVINHIKIKHGKHLGKKIMNNIIDYMSKIIEQPDYIGIYKIKDNEIYVEFIKRDDINILIGINVNPTKDKINISTMYPITDGKIESKLSSGELIEYI